MGTWGQKKDFDLLPCLSAASSASQPLGEAAVPAPAFLGADLNDTLAVLPAQLMGCTGVQSAIIGPGRELGNPGFCNLRIKLQPRSVLGLAGMAPRRDPVSPSLQCDIQEFHTTTRIPIL